MYYEKFISLKPKIFEIIELTNKYMRDYDALMKKYKNKKNIDPIEKRNDLGNIKSKQKLKDYLNNLNNNEIMILRVVMYIGREEKKEISKLNFTQIFEQKFKGLNFELGKEIDKSIQISMMISKSPLAEYLKEGIEKLSYE